MKKGLTPFIFLVLMLSAKAQSNQQMSISIQAHQDDWQLFMAGSFISDFQNNNKVVFITFTAGDAGNGTGSYGSTTPFYIARQNGAIYSTKYFVDLFNSTAPTPMPTAQVVTMNGHSISKFIYKNSVNYFLYLPDGGGDGSGNTITGNESLEKLRLGTISAIHAVNGSATYINWTDLTNTVKAIINSEKGSVTTAWMHTPGLDESVNYGDHSDHLNSARAGQDAVSNLLWVGINEYVDYASVSLPANLSVANHAYVSSIFAVCVWGLIESQYEGTYVDGHKDWLPMEYFTVKRIPITTNNSNIVINKSTATEIPMVVSITTPAYIKQKIELIISPYTKGLLKTIVVNKEGVKVHEQQQSITQIKPIKVTINKDFEKAGEYTVQNILDDKYIQQTKITIQ